MLFDDDTSPNFLARVYQPKPDVFGSDMNPTVVFRGSREPGFASLSDNVTSLLTKGGWHPLKTVLTGLITSPVAWEWHLIIIKKP